ncbi:DUF4407 domain-containing protein [Actinomadura sp. KC216]|uniref:DUF4407 domain-containing protein n=1 Tax=Actinomadura sp. KC216 TaxID=2530370 RepID=UPI0014043CDF|nr:DUF4407 domain-containing protein [Actinomadura sp. KC216]
MTTEAAGHPEKTGARFKVAIPRPSGPWLRGLIGVSEDILDKTPTLRPTYTMLALIVVNAGLLAAVSMLALLAKFLSAPWPLLIPAALVWGWLIFSIDRWLIASMQGSRGVSGGAFFIRLLLALFIGAVVAEPLLLKIFESAIHQEVEKGRIEDRLHMETALKACNPVPYVELDRARHDRCKADDKLLSVSETPAAAGAALERTRDRQSELKSQLAAASERIDAAEETVRRECVGESGPGLTGQAGDGPYCARAREVAEKARRESGLSALQAEATMLAGRMPALVSAKRSADETYERQVDQAIKDKLPPVSGDIGVLEEGMALERLSWQNGFAFVAHWFIRILLILLDCLPILAKKLQGTTSYDEMLTARRMKDEAKHASDEELDQQVHLAENRIAMRRSVMDERHRLDLLEQEDHSARRQRDADLDARIDALAEKLRRRPRPTS